MSLDGNCGKSEQINLIFVHDVACWCGFVYAGSASLFQSLAVIIITRRRGMLAAWHCRRSTGISAYSSNNLGGAHQDSVAGCPY